MRSLIVLFGVLVGSTGLADEERATESPRVKKLEDDRYEVQFRYRPADAVNTVCLAGSFNQWNRSNLPLKGPDEAGWYSRTTKMSAGRYEYKFVVNGDQWHLDPGNPEVVGLHRNNVLRLGEKNRRPRMDKPQRSIRFAWFVDFSPNGKWLVAAYGGWDADEQGEICVWDVERGEPKFVIPSSRGVRTADWSPKGTFFAAGNYAGDIRLYDSASGELKLEIASKGVSAELVQITPDERHIIVGSGNGNILVYDVAAGELVRTLSGHANEVWGMRVSSDGKRLASAGSDRTVRVWDVESGRQLHRFAHPQSTNGVAFSSDGRRLVTGCWDGVIRLWDLQTGKVTLSWRGHQSSVNDFDISPSGDLLASTGGDRTVRLWEFESGDSLATLAGHGEGVYGVRFSPDGETLATGSWDGTIRLWNVKERKPIKTLERK